MADIMTPNPLATLSSLPAWAYGIAGISLAYVLFRPRAAASGAVEFVGAAAGGIVDGAGKATQGVIKSATGIPKTDVDKCRKARADDNLFDSLTYCGVINDFVFDTNGTKPKPKTAVPNPSVNKTAKAKVTLPGGGFISDSGPSFNDILNDPSGYGMSQINYYGLDTVPENAPIKSVAVAGLRG
jgi:hypothetical protein